MKNPKLYDVTQGNLKRSSETAQELVIQAKNKIQEIANKEGLSGIPSGFDKLDKLTSGWQPSDLIIVAARPGMGKTALTLSMAKNTKKDCRIHKPTLGHEGSRYWARGEVKFLPYQ